MGRFRLGTDDGGAPAPTAARAPVSVQAPAKGSALRFGQGGGAASARRAPAKAVATGGEIDETHFGSF
jgi:hypothetical protein